MIPKKIIFVLIITTFSVMITLAAAEIILRFKNSDGKNYHIEMWKYSSVLKQRSDNPVLGHEHVPNKAAKLQNVQIRINEKGLRGSSLPAASLGQRRILLIGSSATLGWGVEEEKTISAQLQKKFKAANINAIVMNAGIGNYNTERYVTLFLEKNKDLNPTDIVVNYYLNDAEVLAPGGGNVLIRNSQLAVTFWILANRLKGTFGHTDLLSHYKETYKKTYPGFIRMNKALGNLANYAKQNNIRLYLMIMPEVHDISNYKYDFAHEIMQEISMAKGYIYVDALPAMKKVDDAQSLWTMPSDPHPNNIAHSMFADILYPFLINTKSQ